MTRKRVKTSQDGKTGQAPMQTDSPGPETSAGLATEEQPAVSGAGVTVPGGFPGLGLANLLVVYMAVSELKPADRNPRTHSERQVQQIAKSIREFGFVNPVLLDKDRRVIAGHGRIAAAASLGLETVPCIQLDHMTEAQRRAYVLADNKIALNSGWDEDLLRMELLDLKELGADLELTGFDAMEIADLTLGRDVEFKAYDESAAEDVELITCPKCGHSFPK